MKHLYLTVVGIIMSANILCAQTTLWQEDFETDGNGSRYNASNTFYGTTNDHFNRTDGTNIDIGDGGVYGGINGTQFFAIEDADDVNGDGFDYKKVEFYSFSSAGFTNINFKGLFAAGSNTLGDFDRKDGAVVSYSVDGGATWTQGVKFRYDNNDMDGDLTYDDFNEKLGVLTTITQGCAISTADDGFDDAACDAEIPDAAANISALLTSTMSEHGFAIPGSPTTIEIRIEMSFDAGDEEFAFDNFRVTGDVDCATLTTAPTSQNITCNGFMNGTATANASGGAGGYTYAWSNGSNSDNVGSLMAGTYGLTVTDGNACSVTNAVTITEPAPVNVTVTVTDETCLEGDGSASSTVTGGTGGYNYNWSNGGNGPSISNLYEGNYSVNVWDMNGCSGFGSGDVNSDRLRITVTPTNSTCGNSDGTASIVVTGGVSPYSYIWTNGATTTNVTGLNAGIVLVTVSETQGCMEVDGAPINDIGAPNITLTQNNETCKDASDGSLVVTASGGATPYTYNWANGETGAPMGTSSTLTGLPNENFYLVTVTDALGCISANGDGIQGPWQALQSSQSSNNVTTNGGNDGSASVWAWDGWNSGYTYSWSNGASTSFISSLTAGVYSATITDAGGCSTIETMTLSEPPPCNISATSGQLNDHCNTMAGWANANPVLGYAPFSYSWSNGTNSQLNTNLGAGMYSATITDMYGCQATTSVTITSPPNVDFSVSTTNAACGASDGALLVHSQSGGQTPYVYAWSNAATTAGIAGLGAGNFAVTMTDANGCWKAANASIINPGAPNVTATQTDVICNGGNNGSVNLTVAGGTTPYTYAWSNGATTQSLTGLVAGSYSYTVSDGAGPSCSNTGNVEIFQPSAIDPGMNWNDVSFPGNTDGSASSSPNGGTGTSYTYNWTMGETTWDIFGLAEGTWTVTVTDMAACTQVGQVTVSAPFQCNMTLTETHVDDLCGQNAGSITASATGGALPYWYNWSNFSNGTTVGGLASGADLNITVWDNNGCMEVINNITINGPMNEISSTVTTADATCGNSDGSASVVVTGGTTPYNYLWMNGVTTTSQTGLAAGAALVTITDANSCVNVDGAAVNNPGAPAISMSTQNVSCIGDTDGSASVEVTGGQTPYTYNWTDINGVPAGTTQSLTGLAEGTYLVTVTDAQVPGCAAVEGETVHAPPAIITSLDWSWNPNCANSSDGQANISNIQGNWPISYLWEDASTSDWNNSLHAGANNVTVTDGNGCTDLFVINLAAPAAITVTTSTVDANCGQPDGSATAVATGTQGGANFVWSNGGGSDNISNVFAGNYGVTVTDGWGCKGQSTATINNGNGPLVSVTTTPVACNGGNDGTATAAVTGGSTPYTYVWAGGETTIAVVGLTAGNATLTVTDNSGCQAAGLAAVNQPTPLSVVVSHVNPTTIGGSDGSFTATAAGGSPGYTYLWDNAATTPMISGTVAGTRSVTVTDNNGCETSGDDTSVDPACTTILDMNDGMTSCNGGNDGSVSVAASNGVAPYAYIWDNGSVTSMSNALAAGAHGVTVTDAVNCVVSADANVTEPSAITLTASANNALCNGSADGDATVVAAGGTPGYTYAWDNGATTSVIGSLSAGSYDVTVMDANGCMATANSVVAEPSALAITTTSSNSTCGNADGDATAAVSGGSTPYSYAWSSGATIATAPSLASGNYDVTVTDVNGCEIQANANVSDASAPSLDATATGNPVACNGDATVSVSTSVSGGVSPFTYMWTTGSTASSVTGLGAGSYGVTVTDANGCIDSKGGTVNEPAAIAINATVTNVACNGDNSGDIATSISGGTGAYVLAWSTGGATSDINDVMAGTYGYTVTDANGCEASASYTVTEPTAISVTDVSTDAACNGDANGAIDLTASGGAAGWMYNWSDASTTEDVSGLVAGSYDVTVSDANGCNWMGTYVIGEPAALAASTTQTDATGYSVCDGSVTVATTGGSTLYTYLWSDGQTTTTASNLCGSAGGTSYDVTVTDANGCEVTASDVVGEPDELLITVTAADIDCNGAGNGTVMVVATGGVGAYAYAWDNGATTDSQNGLAAGGYDVTVTDANGNATSGSATVAEPSAITLTTVATDASCNGMSDGAVNLTAAGGTGAYTFMWFGGETTEDLSNVPAGTYNVTVTDANGCMAMASDVVAEPTAVTAGLTIGNASCGAADGSADLVGAGGVSPYTYDWSNGGTTASITGVMAGVYDYTVTDATGCGMTGSAGVIDNGAPSLTITNSTNVACNGTAGGDATVSASGGGSVYNYLWSDGQTTATAANLVANVYSVQITDNNGCVAVAMVTITEPDALSSTSTIVDVDCNGNNTGSIDVVMAGGAGGYVYNWDNGSASATNTGLAAGTHVVTVSDANGCEYMLSETVTEPAVLAASTTVTDVTCGGDADGMIAAAASGGTAPYAYMWSTGETTWSIAGLAGGSYDATVTDNNGCMIMWSETVNESAALAANVTVMDAACNGDANGSVAIDATGGTGALTYAWSTGGTGTSASGLIAGAYDVTITDDNGCMLVVADVVNEPATLDVTVDAAGNLSCNGANDGSIDIEVTGGTMPYTYVWSNGDTTEDVMNLDANAFDVTVTDANGCMNGVSVTITEPDALALTLTATDASCNSYNDGDVASMVTGGTAPYSYLWSDGATTANINMLFAGSFNVTVMDDNGCMISGGDAVAEPTAVSGTTASTPAACGVNDGSVAITAAGGVTGYTYAWSNGSVDATATGLAAGTYDYTITDATGCYAMGSDNVNNVGGATIDGVTVTDVLCYGDATGEAAIAVSGGGTAYTFAWDDGQTTQTATGLAAGSYIVQVTDNNGCITVGGAAISEEAELVLAYNVTDVSCNGDSDGEIDLVVTGGEPLPFMQYLWSDASINEDLTGLAAGTYSVTVLDGNGCMMSGSTTVMEPSMITLTSAAMDATCNGNDDGAVDAFVAGGTMPYTYAWSNGDTAEDALAITAGVYVMTVTDANGCMDVVSTTVEEPTALDASTSVTAASCGGADGSATVMATGGTTPYAYGWNSGDMTATTSGLMAGFVEVTVTDGNGCMVIASDVINTTGGAAVAMSSSDVVCNGADDGTGTATVTGGTTPYTYAWDDAGMQTTSVAAGLAPGTYSVQVNDAGGCMIVEMVTISEPTAMSTTITGTDADCGNVDDATATAVAAGGVGGYTYAWDNGGNTSTINGLAAGTYSVVVSDANGCVDAAAIVLNTNPVLNVSVSLVDAICSAPTGTATATVTGGVTGYAYAWSNGETTAVATGSPSDVMSATITDGLGCEIMASVTVSALGSVSVTTSSTDVTCNGDGDGSASASATGGDSNYSYVWSDASNGISISGADGGTYGVTVTDGEGCEASTSVAVVEPAALAITATTDCGVGAGVDHIVTVSGGTSAYSYLWTNGSTTNIANTVAGGSLDVDVADANGCTIGLTGLSENCGVGIEAFDAASVSMYPNPVRDNMYLSLGTDIESVTVRNVLGALIGTYQRTSSNMTIDMNGLDNGVYFMSIQIDGKEVSTKRFVKTN